MSYSHFLKIIALCGLLSCHTSLISAQESLSKFERLKKIEQPKPKEQYRKYLNKSSNEMELTGAFLFVGYKYVFSSQDMASCVFTPSCSVYSIQSLQTDHPLLAYVKIFDRLSRCHPLTAKGEYPYYKNTAQLYDPVH